MINSFNPLRSKRSGQALVEFALALPLLLLILFGIIEFGRLLQSWMTVQNAARFGLRYAVTGEYDDTFCASAVAAIDANLSTVDVAAADNLDGEIDCQVPDEYDDSLSGDPDDPDVYSARELTELLVDWARLPTIREHSRTGGAGLSVTSDASVLGDYITYLLSHDAANLGQWQERGYFHVMTCSNRDNDIPANGSDFYIDDNSEPLTCKEYTSGVLMDDAGGPGDRVRVTVTYVHPMILPLVSSIWPEVPLIAWREGIVEKFRTSRVSGMGGQIADAPTVTPIPPTETFTPTATETPVPPTATEPPPPTPTPDCSFYSLGDVYFSSNGWDLVSANVTNNTAIQVGVDRIVLNWDYAEDLGELMNYRNLLVDWMQVNGSYVWGSHDNDDPPQDSDSVTDSSSDSPDEWHGPGIVPGNSTVAIIADMDNTWDNFETDGRVIPSDFGYEVYLDNGCFYAVAPAPRPLPTPDCDAYTMSDFTLLNNGNIRMQVNNGDLYNAHVTRINLDWAYLEELIQASYGNNNLRSDWFSFGVTDGTVVWGAGNGGAFDLNSSTDTSVDSPETWTGPLLFEAGRSYYYRADFDMNPEEPVDWMAQRGIVSDDFGVTIDFDNGCQLVRPPVTRPVATSTPDCSLLYATNVSLSVNSTNNTGDFEIQVQNDNLVPAYLIESTLWWPTNWDPTGQFYLDMFRFLSDPYYNPSEPVTSSPVFANVPNLALNNMQQSWWEARFRNYPLNLTNEGCFAGELVFDMGGRTCTIYEDLCIQPTPTPTVTRTPTRTSPVTPTNTMAPTRTSTATLVLKPTDTRTPTPTSGAAPNTPTLTPTRTQTSSVVTRTPTRTPTATVAAPSSTTGPSPTPCLTPPDLGGC